MKLSLKPALLSLCALTLLSACAKDNQPIVGVNPITDPQDDVTYPDDGTPSYRENLRMVRTGYRESNDMRRRYGLMPMQYDQNLAMSAQRRAREIRYGNSQNNGFSQNNEWQNQNNSAGPDGMPIGMSSTNGRREDKGGRGNEGRRDEGRRDDGRGNEGRFPNQPPQSVGSVELTISGLRSSQQAFLNFSRNPQANANLMNSNYRRQGIGYFDGTWVVILGY